MKEFTFEDLVDRYRQLRAVVVVEDPSAGSPGLRVVAPEGMNRATILAMLTVAARDGMWSVGANQPEDPPREPPREPFIVMVRP